MKCHTCGGDLKSCTTAMPFKLGPSTIVIIKGLPVWQCGNCVDFLIEDSAMIQVDTILSKSDESAELEIVRFAA